jgi:hypothetical protein
VERVFVANSGHSPGILGLWMLVPITLAAAAIPAVRTQSIGLVWAIVGAVWGFVIIAAWSLGTFFAWEGLALLAAGVLHTIAVGPRWKLLPAPLWLVAGASALCPMFLARNFIREAASHGAVTVTHAPVLVYGSEIWAGAVALLCAIELISRAMRRTTPAGDRA